MNGWIAALAGHAEAGTPAVLVTVIETVGSSPRQAGAKLVVTADGCSGTIGGGHLELSATEQARAILAAEAEGRPGSPRAQLREVALGPTLGQCCGGKVTLLLELVAPPPWRVAVFGAGHVGRALVRLLADLACRVEWVDERPEAFPATIPPNVRRTLSDAPDEVVARLPAGCDVLVMTHSHQLDQAVVEAVLGWGRQRFLGLIGSATKRARCLARLEHRGVPEAVRDRLTCPIGLPGVGGKRPTEIAIAVAAQLLQLEQAEVAARSSNGQGTPLDGSRQGAPAPLNGDAGAAPRGR